VKKNKDVQKETFMKIRFSLLFLLFLFGSLILMACGNTPSTDTSSGVSGQNPTATTSVSLETKLAIGTLKLSATEQDITTAQAAELLTLWKAYQVLSNSDTTAQSELSALVQQIEETMTSEQIQAIDNMQITAESMSEFIQPAMPQTSSTSLSDTTTGQAAVPLDGAGGIPVDGSAPPDGGTMGDLSMAGAGFQTTSDIADQSISQIDGINPVLINALIQMLETKTQANL